MRKVIEIESYTCERTLTEDRAKSCKLRGVDEENVFFESHSLTQIDIPYRFRKGDVIIFLHIEQDRASSSDSYQDGDSHNLHRFRPLRGSNMLHSARFHYQLCGEDIICLL
jgi:hypothetical protein